MRLSTNVTTQCPQCAGQFDVSMAQLQLRKGFVRCVHCAHIFDGYESVVPEGGAAPASNAAPPHSDQALDPSDHALTQSLDQTQDPGHDTPSATDETDATGLVSSQMTVQPAVIRQRHTIAAPVDALDDEDTIVFSISDPPPAPAPEAPAPVWQLGDQDDDAAEHPPAETMDAERRTPTPPVLAPLPDFLERVKPRGWRFWCWSVLALLALLLMLVQTVVIYRVQLASQYPAARPLLTRLCGVWGCRVDYPRRLDRIAVLSSSLRMQPRSDQNQDAATRLVLHVTLRNQDERPQQWPTVLLDMTDFSGAVVIRKHLHPADYLPEHLIDQAFAGRSELALQLSMVVQGVSVNGYQIKPFFP